jgi:hypothetical protein
LPADVTMKIVSAGGNVFVKGAWPNAWVNKRLVLTKKQV